MMVERGTPSFAVQQFAGHASIGTTEGYVHLAQQRTAFQFQKSSVVDGLSIIKDASRHGRKKAPVNECGVLPRLLFACVWRGWLFCQRTQDVFRNKVLSPFQAIFSFSHSQIVQFDSHLGETV